MAREFPLPESSPAALNFAEKPLADLDRLIRRHVEEGRYPGAQIALARHGQIALFRTYGEARSRRGGERRHAVAAVLADQGADHRRDLEPGRRRHLVVQRPGRRPPPRIRRARQGRHHPVPGHHPPGRLSVGRCEPRKLGRPCADAPRGLRLQAGMAGRVTAALPCPRRAPDLGDGDRGGHRARLPRGDSRTGDRPARRGRRTVRRRAGRRAAPLRRHARAGQRPAARQQQRDALGRAAERRRFRHGAGDGGVLSDDAAWRPARRGQVVLAAPHRVRHPRLHRRPARRGDDRHPDAPGPGAALARHRPAHPRAGTDGASAAPLGMAAPARRIPGPTRRRGCRSAT